MDGIARDLHILFISHISHRYIAKFNNFTLPYTEWMTLVIRTAWSGIALHI